MSSYVDENQAECNFSVHYTYAKTDDAQVGCEEVTLSSETYCVWTRYKGVGGNAWQTTVQKMQDNDPNGYDGNQTFSSNRDDAVTEHANIKTKIEAGDPL